MSVTDFRGKVFTVGDTVVRMKSPAGGFGKPHLVIETVTTVEPHFICLDNRKRQIDYPDRLVIIERSAI